MHPGNGNSPTHAIEGPNSSLRDNMSVRSIATGNLFFFCTLVPEVFSSSSQTKLGSDYVSRSNKKENIFLLSRHFTAQSISLARCLTWGQCTPGTTKNKTKQRQAKVYFRPFCFFFFVNTIFYQEF